MAATMLARKAVSGAVAVRPAKRAVTHRLVVRSSNDAEPSTSQTVEFQSAPKVAPSSSTVEAVPVAASPAAPSIIQAMSFAGPGPELINGRLAMVGVLAAIGAELATGESVLTQFESATPVVLATWALISVASLVPILRGAAGDEAFGPLTPQAERYNGWVAMMGLAFLLIIELVKGSALF